MRVNGLQLGDLLNLEGLEKPRQEIKTWSLSGRSEKRIALADGLSDFSGKIEGQSDLCVSDVTGLVGIMNKALMRELSPEKEDQFLEILKNRFLSILNRHGKNDGALWVEVEKRLKNSPEKIWSLQQMENTGGHPELMELESETDEYIFMDTSAESPKGRRNCLYDKRAEKILKAHPGLSQKFNGSALVMAELMGVELLTDEQYRRLQRRYVFDRETWNWLKTPAGIDGALVGNRNGDEVVVRAKPTFGHGIDTGWRGVLKV